MRRAVDVEVSIKTVHDYVGMLYKHFHVSSRAELLAYFIRRQPMPGRRYSREKSL